MFSYLHTRLIGSRLMVQPQATDDPDAENSLETIRDWWECAQPNELEIGYR